MMVNRIVLNTKTKTPNFDSVKYIKAILQWGFNRIKITKFEAWDMQKKK